MIDIQLGVDSTQAERGLGRLGDSLGDVVDDLTDLGRDGERATERLADGLDDAGDSARDLGTDAERAMADVEDATQEAERVISRDLTQALDDAAAASADAGDSIGRNIREGAEEGATGGGETIGEFKDEATANFSELASGFSGDMTGAVDLVQGTLGGLAGSIPGGLGVALGGLAIAGGAFAAAWQKAAEDTEKRTADMYADMLASQNAFLSDTYIQDQYYAIVQGTEDAILSMKDLEKITGQTGLTQEQVALAFAGNGEQMALVQAKLTDHQEVFNKQLEDSIDTNDSAAKAGRDWAQESIDQAQRRNEEIAKTEENYKRQADALATYGTVSSGAIRELEAAEVSFAATVDDSVASIAEQGATLDINTEAGRANKEALLGIVDEAESMNTALKNAGGTTTDLSAAMALQRAEFVNAATAAGLTEDAANALADSYGLVPETVTTAVSVTGAPEATAEIDGVVAPRTVSVTPKIDFSPIQGQMDNWFASARQPVITPRAQFGQQVK